MICPIDTTGHGVLLSLAVGLASVAMTFPSRDAMIGRWRGVALLLLYAAFIGFMLNR